MNEISKVSMADLTATSTSVSADMSEATVSENSVFTAGGHPKKHHKTHGTKNNVEAFCKHGSHKKYKPLGSGHDTGSWLKNACHNN